MCSQRDCGWSTRDHSTLCYIRDYHQYSTELYKYEVLVLFQIADINIHLFSKCLYYEDNFESKQL